MWVGKLSGVQTLQHSRRSYATEPELRKASEGEPEITGKSPLENAQAEDPVKKELEAKNREVIELKVCHHRLCDPLFTKHTV